MHAMSTIFIMKSFVASRAQGYVSIFKHYSLPITITQLGEKYKLKKRGCCTAVKTLVFQLPFQMTRRWNGYITD